jgi:hypothetical protein
MASQSNSGYKIRNNMNNDLPEKKSKKQQFKRGFRRYANKNLYFGRKAFIRRVQYRKMVWEKAPPLFIAFLIVLTILVIIIDIIDSSIELHPLIFVILIVLFCLASILEIWYVGTEKKQSRIGRKIRRKKREEEWN